MTAKQTAPAKSPFPSRYTPQERNHALRPEHLCAVTGSQQFSQPRHVRCPQRQTDRRLIQDSHAAHRNTSRRCDIQNTSVPKPSHRARKNQKKNNRSRPFFSPASSLSAHSISSFPIPLTPPSSFFFSPQRNAFLLFSGRRMNSTPVKPPPQFLTAHRRESLHRYRSENTDIAFRCLPMSRICRTRHRFFSHCPPLHICR